MPTEAQRRATANYRKNNTKAYAMRFYPAEMELWEWLDSRPEGKAAYLKRLIREDMERETSNS